MINVSANYESEVGDRINDRQTMKKPIFVGAIGCGKTTLCQRLQGAALDYRKTQAVEFYQDMIDTPGEFVEHHQLYNALTVTAAEADVIVLLQSVSDRRQTFSPGFGSMFPKPKVGIVTKIDLVKDQKDIDWAATQLELAGAKKIFSISAEDDEGIQAIVDYLGISQSQTA